MNNIADIKFCGAEKSCYDVKITEEHFKKLPVLPDITPVIEACCNSVSLWLLLLLLLIPIAIGLMCFMREQYRVRAANGGLVNSDTSTAPANFKTNCPLDDMKWHVLPFIGELGGSSWDTDSSVLMSLKENPQNRPIELSQPSDEESPNLDSAAAGSTQEEITAESGAVCSDGGHHVESKFVSEPEVNDTEIPR